MTNPLEALALSFLKKEATKNPQVLANFVGHILTEKGVSPDIVKDVDDVLTQAIPFLVTAIALVLCLVLPGRVWAQTAPVVEPQTTAQKINDAISYGTVSADVVGQVIHDLQDPNKACALKKTLVSVSLTEAIVFAVKPLVHRLRPDGSDYNDVPSGHTALAFATTGWSMGYSYTLALGTGVERRTANKHDWLGVLTGAAVGQGSRWTANWLGPKILGC